MYNFHHFSILAKSSKETRFFYEKVLGLRLVKNTVNQANTKMPHLFFGDEVGSSGSLLTFFIMSKLGNRTDGEQFFDNTTLAIPKNSSLYWQERLNHFSIPYTIEDNHIKLIDEGMLTLHLQEETMDVLSIDPKNRFSDIPADKQIQGISEITLYTSKLAETIDFFRRFLTLPVENRVLHLPNQQKIYFAPATIQKRTRFGNGSMDHIALDAGSPENLQMLYERAQEQNWQIEEYVDRGYFKSLYIREPGGLRIEFATTGPGFLMDESFETLGQSLSLPPFLLAEKENIIKNLEEST